MSNNYTETELQLIINKITSAQASSITMNEGELYLAPDNAVYSVNNITPTNGNVSIPEGANKDLSNLSSTGNSKFQAPITGGASTITSSNLTTNRALVSNSSGKVTVSSVTLSELGYVSGVTSKIQTQLNNKVTSNSAITGATKCKITYDSKGLVTSGTNLSASDIPDLSETYYPASNPNNFTSNAGTVTSVNNIQPVNGNVTIDTGATRNIGEIVQSTIPLTDAGLHLLDGALIDGNGIYSAFVDYIASIYDASASYFTTEASWQDSVTNYGVCGKFVYDSVNNTVRLPKYSNKIYTGGGTAPVIGNGITLGLTDGTHSRGLGYYQTEHLCPGGDGYGMPIGSTNGSAGGFNYGKSIGITTDPTKSGLIAQLSDITTSVDGYYYIVVATSTKTDIQVDIDEIATDLNGKVDKSSLSEVYPVVETYMSGTSWYRVYSDGWCEQGGKSQSQGQTNVSLIKSYTNTEYSVLLTNNQTGAGNADITTRVIQLNKNSFSYFAEQLYNNVITWQTSGYIR